MKFHHLIISKVKIIIEKSYGKPIHNIFKEFSKEPVASASVAQVHFAKLLNGKEVAVKILRPNIEKEVDKDIKLLRIFSLAIRVYMVRWKKT